VNFSVCVDMTASGGGFYQVTDLHQHYQHTETFTPTQSSTRRICFTYDMTSPVHCTQPGTPSSSSCNSQPLELSTRLTRTPEVPNSVCVGGGWVEWCVCACVRACVCVCRRVRLVAWRYELCAQCVNYSCIIFINCMVFHGMNIISFLRF
jgi:hypothetical protein